jgi:glutaredoxin
MRIEVFFGRSCPHQEATRQVLAEALAEAGAADAEVVSVQVEGPEEARARKMLGSPTIRVNGVDVEYGDREPDETSAGCRYFATPEGWKPVPPRGLIVRALTTALARERA